MNTQAEMATVGAHTQSSVEAGNDTECPHLWDDYAAYKLAGLQLADSRQEDHPIFRCLTRRSQCSDFRAVAER
jgi:hypothetical protein